MAGYSKAPYYSNTQWPGADGIRVPVEVLGSAGAGLPGGTMSLIKQVTHNYNGTAANWALAPAETAASHIIVTNASGAATATFPAANPGQRFSVFNNSGQAVTFLVAGQTGVVVATGKRAILVCESTDIARVTADT
jgi:hypothetical protein